MKDASLGTILITGGAQRLGLYNALRLKDLGYRVIITYRRERERLREIREQGVETLQADFSSDLGIKTFIEEVRGSFDSLRALIHNASLWYPDEEILAQEGNERFLDLVYVHMIGPFTINYGLRELLEASRPGIVDEEHAVSDIIHMTDFVSRRGSKKHVAYASTKAGLENMTQSFAARFGPRIKVNSIAPALVKFNTWDSEEYRKKVELKSIMGFEPGEEVNYRALMYLLTNPYVTGTCLHLDGGRHLV